MADPPVLLLDEATSALDEENQSKVQEGLLSLFVHCSTSKVVRESVFTSLSVVSLEQAYEGKDYYGDCT